MPARILRPHFIATATLAAVLSLAPICGDGDEKIAAPTSTVVVATIAASHTLALTATAAPTDTPEPAATEEPVLTVVPMPAWSSPPVADSEGMVLPVSVWVDGQPAGGELIAFVNGTECGRAHGFNFNSEPPGPPSFIIGIESDDHQSGCGVPGATVTFSVDGRSAVTTIPWLPGGRPHSRVVVGAPFAQYYGHLDLDAGLPPTMRVVPYVDGVACGVQIAGGELYTPYDWSYDVTVYADVQRSGCGYDGAQVSFMLEIDGQPSVDLGTEVWDTRLPVIRATIDVTGRIAMRPAP